MIKVLMWGVDELFPQLAPYYEYHIRQGAMQVVGYGVKLSDNTGGGRKKLASR